MPPAALTRRSSLFNCAKGSPPPPLLSHGRGCAAQVNWCCPLSRARGAPQAALARLNNRAADGQSYTVPWRFRGEERAKNLFGPFGNPMPVSLTRISNWPSLTSSEPIVSSRGPDTFFMAFDVTEHEVHEHLLQLNIICHWLAKIFWRGLLRMSTGWPHWWSTIIFEPAYSHPPGSAGTVF